MNEQIPIVSAPAIVMAPTTETSSNPKATMAPSTTAEQDRRTRGQRLINAVWESTQAVIALSVIGTALYVDGFVAINGVSLSEGQSSALMQLNVMGALVTGFYFGRTNHTREGGVQQGR